MNKTILLAVFTLLLFKSYSQIKFEAGYIITNDGDKRNCFIKNIDWKNNPSEIIFKYSMDSTQIKGSIEEISEFGIYNQFTFKRYDVKIDQTSDDIENFSTEKEPRFTKETVFLKELVEGKASLYYYEKGNLERYFYSIDSSKVEQLVYKTYRDSADIYVMKKNNLYQQQLWIGMQSSGITIKEIEQLKCNKDYLVPLFKKYNKIHSSVSIVLEDSSNTKKHLFHLNLRPRIESSNLSLSNSLNSFKSVSFGNKTNLNVGVEIEYILPFNKNKWALILEPTYQNYKGSAVYGTWQDTYEVSYKSIGVPIGVRHSFFLSENSKIFINCSYLLNFQSGSAITFNKQPYLEIVNSASVQFGIGYTLYKKYSAEIRYFPSRQLLGFYDYWSSNFTSTSLILGYRIF